MPNPRRLAVVADAHGNSVGLRAVVEDIGRTGVDETIILGDMVYGVDPAGTFDLIRALPAPRCILGNAELYLLTPPMTDPPASVQAVVRAVQTGCAWTGARLGEHRLNEIRSWAE
ncbi:MAG: metallophosphoesterase family protein [Spirochaetota bacterium]